MLLKHRPPGIESQPATLREGLAHLDQKSVAVLRWLVANKVDFVVVGPVAHAIRGDVNASGAVAIVPAPYGRNYERLCTALVAEHAGLRADRSVPGLRLAAPGGSGQADAEKLARGKRWMLHFGDYDLDLEEAGARRAVGPATGQGDTRALAIRSCSTSPARFELADGLSVEVASPEDLEHFSHVRRTGDAPEFRVIRKAAGRARDRVATAAGRGREPATRGRVTPRYPEVHAATRQDGPVRCRSGIVLLALTWYAGFHISLVERADRSILRGFADLYAARPGPVHATPSPACATRSRTWSSPPSRC